MRDETDELLNNLANGLTELYEVNPPAAAAILTAITSVHHDRPHVQVDVARASEVVRGYVTRLLSELGIDQKAAAVSAYNAARLVEARLPDAIADTVQFEIDRAIFVALPQKTSNEASRRVQSLQRIIREKAASLPTRAPLPGETRKRLKPPDPPTVDEVAVVARFDRRYQSRKAKMIKVGESPKGLKAKLLKDYLAQPHILSPHGSREMVSRARYDKLAPRVHALSAEAVEWAMTAVQKRIADCGCASCRSLRKPEK